MIQLPESPRTRLNELKPGESIELTADDASEILGPDFASVTGVERAKAIMRNPLKFGYRLIKSASKLNKGGVSTTTYETWKRPKDYKGRTLPRDPTTVMIYVTEYTDGRTTRRSACAMTSVGLPNVHRHGDTVVKQFTTDS